MSELIDDAIVTIAAEAAKVEYRQHCGNDTDCARAALKAVLPMIGEKLAAEFKRIEQIYVPDTSAIDVRLSWQDRSVWPNGKDIAARIRELTRKP